MTDKMREEFELWAITCPWLGLSDECMARDEINGGYYGLELHSAWLAWQASREALVIELPAPYAVVGDYVACGGGRSVWDVVYAEKITDRMCQKIHVYDRASLEVAGLKVKS
jgi:hypothetical protein